MSSREEHDTNVRVARLLVLRHRAGHSLGEGVTDQMIEELYTIAHSKLSTESEAPFIMAKKSNETATGDLISDSKYSDVTVQKDKETSKIILPGDMSAKEGIEWLKKQDAEDEKMVGIFADFDCFPLDGAHALGKVIVRLHGFTGTVGKTLVSAETGPNGETTQIPWGALQVPGINGVLEMDMCVWPIPKFQLRGQVKQRDKDKVDAIIEAVHDELRTASLYRGKTFMIDLSWMREGRKFHPTNDAPKFNIDTSSVTEDQLILSEDCATKVNLGIFVPIKHPDACRQNRIPLKRGVVLEGEYGLGKTLTATVTAGLCLKAGWTFIYLKDVMDLAAAFVIAAQYQPCVIFAEDVDRVVGVPENQPDYRSEAMDQVLNAFDGVGNKGVELITILTTNHVKKITPALLRPGRCDVLVHLERPDASAAARLVQLYSRGLLAVDADMDAIGAATQGHLPAEIREIMERAKLATILRLNGSPDITGAVTSDDVLAAVLALKGQHEMLQPKVKPDSGLILDRMANTLGSAIGMSMARGASKGVAVLGEVIAMTGGNDYEVAKGLAQSASANGRN